MIDIYLFSYWEQSKKIKWTDRYNKNNSNIKKGQIMLENI